MDSKPELDQHLVLVFNLWTFLHGRRQVGFTANPIALSDMLAGLDLYGVERRDQREDWIEMLVALDHEFLSDNKRKGAAARAANRAKAKGKGKR